MTSELDKTDPTQAYNLSYTKSLHNEADKKVAVGAIIYELAKKFSTEDKKSSKYYYN